LAADPGENSLEDPGQMLPDGMGAPVATACKGTTFGEQLMCALLPALTSLLQQAFANQGPQ